MDIKIQPVGELWREKRGLDGCSLKILCGVPGGRVMSIITCGLTWFSAKS